MWSYPGNQLFQDMRILRTTSHSIGRNELLQELLQSDIAYFHAAAECESLAGFQISRMPGLESLPAACVAHLESQPVDSRGLAMLEARLSGLGCGYARVYQLRPDDQLARLFQHNGYRQAEEIGLLNTFDERNFLEPANEPVSLHPVRSENDWSRKMTLHREIPQGPDGHPCLAETWVRMERLKYQSGYMEPYLIMNEDRVCGAVNFAPGSRIGRLKNIVIHPEWRSKGIGEKAARLIALLAWERGYEVAGCFAIKNGPALNMYQNAGYTPAILQTEWFKLLRCPP